MSLTTSRSSESVTSTNNSSSPSSIDLCSDRHYQQPLPWIVHHLLDFKIPDELSLRIMFSFNSGAQMPSLTNAHRWWNDEYKGKPMIEFLSSLPSVHRVIYDVPLYAEEVSQVEEESGPGGKKDVKNKDCQEGQKEISEIEHLTKLYKQLRPHQHCKDRFMDEGNAFLFNAGSFGAELPPQHRSASQGLPLDFIVRFCLKVMAPRFEEVDFHQALTAIDYLRDYECSRRQQMQEAMVRIGFQQGTDAWLRIIRGEQDVKRWVEEVQRTELRIEKWYAEAFLDLRIWTMVAELKSKHYYKPNALAMLNTLFPPSIHHLLSTKIDVEEMYRYRAEFYHCIAIVELLGPRAMDDTIRKLDREKHSWKNAYSSLESYFDASQYTLMQANDPAGVTYHFDKRKSPLSQIRAARGHSPSARSRKGSVMRTYSTNERHRMDNIAYTGIVTLGADFNATPVGNPPLEPLDFSRTKIWKTVLNHGDPETLPAANTEGRLADSRRESGNVLKGPLKPILKLSTPRTTYSPIFSPTPFPGVNRQIDPDRPVHPLGYRPPPVVVSAPEKSPGWDGKFVTKVTQQKMRSGSTSVLGPAKLPSDNLDFLNRPFREQELPSGHQVVKAVSNFGRLFSRKASATELRKTYAGDGLGIGYNVRSTENFARYPNNPRDAVPNAAASDRRPRPLRTSTVRLMEEDGQQLPKQVKKMKSMSSILPKKKPVPSILKNKGDSTSDSRLRSQTAESQVRRSIGPIPPPMPTPVPKQNDDERKKDSVISQEPRTPPLDADAEENGFQKRTLESQTPAHHRQEVSNEHNTRAITPTVEDCNETSEDNGQSTIQAIMNEIVIPSSPSKRINRTHGLISATPSYPNITMSKIERTRFTRTGIDSPSAQKTSSNQYNIRSASTPKYSLTPTYSLLPPNIRLPSVPKTKLDQSSLRSPILQQLSLSGPVDASASTQQTSSGQSNIPSPTLQQQFNLSQRTIRPPNMLSANYSHPRPRLPSAQQSSPILPNRPPPSVARQTRTIQPALRDPLSELSRAISPAPMSDSHLPFT